MYNKYHPSFSIGSFRLYVLKFLVNLYIFLIWG
jgi:hypothetical protein